jgi:putative ABC transport system ATP-binding protein
MQMQDAMAAVAAVDLVKVYGSGDTAAYADRVVLLADGRVAGEIERPDITSVSNALHNLAVAR